MRNPYEYAFRHPVLEKMLNNLTLLQFFKENGIAISDDYKAVTDLDNEEIAHAAFIASFLASSSLDRHKQKAIAFAILVLREKRCPRVCKLLLYYFFKNWDHTARETSFNTF